MSSGPITVTGPLPSIGAFAESASGSSGTSFRVTALGGGHGLKSTLRALRVIAAEHLTAICTVADDGGSSGRLREEMDVLPPGICVWR